MFLHRFGENISRLFSSWVNCGHRHFPWMQLHCNFQGLVAELNSDKDILTCCCVTTEQLLKKAVEVNYKLALVQQQSDGHPITFAAQKCFITRHSPTLLEWPEGRVGRAYGCGNDRCWLHWRHMVTRLEFCLGQFLPPFPGGLRMASQHHEAIHKLLVLLCWTSGSSCSGHRLTPGTSTLEPIPWVSLIFNNSV